MQITVAGEKIRVREHRDDERFTLRDSLGPIVQHFMQLAQQKNSEAPDVEALFEKYVEQFARLIAASCGKELAWVESLNDTDCAVLFAAWWEVNRAFFVKCMLRRKGIVPPARASRTIN